MQSLILLCFFLLSKMCFFLLFSYTIIIFVICIILLYTGFNVWPSWDEDDDEYIKDMIIIYFVVKLVATRRWEGEGSHEDRHVYLAHHLGGYFDDVHSMNKNPNPFP